MRTLTATLFVTAVLFFTACTQKPSVQELLKNDKTRAEIMNAICNDSDMVTEMINKMSTTGASQKMLPMSCEMLGKIMASDVMKRDTAMQKTVISSMLQLITKDSVLCDKTCNQMYQIPSVKRFLEKRGSN